MYETKSIGQINRGEAIEGDSLYALQVPPAPHHTQYHPPAQRSPHCSLWRLWQTHVEEAT